MRVWLRILGAIAGLYGAAGVGLAAVGAHMSGQPNVTTAAYFFLFHAAALLGLCAIAVREPSRVVLAAATLIASGTLLFSGDLALRALAHVTPIHLAAPTGGIILIVGWLVAAVALAASI